MPLLGMVVSVAIGALAAGLTENQTNLLLAPLYLLTFPLMMGAQGLYFAAFESSRFAATPGKLMLGLKVRPTTNGNSSGPFLVEPYSPRSMFSRDSPAA